MRGVLRSLASQVGCRSCTITNLGMPTAFLVLILMCVHDVGSDGLLRDGTTSLSRSRDQRSPAGPPDLKNSPCYKHNTCSECLQDPCSRYLALGRDGSGSDICVWCAQVRDVRNEGLPKEACLPKNLAYQSYCLPEYMVIDEYGEVCKFSVEINEEKEGNCMVLGDNFALDLTSRMYTHVNPDGYPPFDVFFGVCQPVLSSTSVGQQCGSKAPIQILERSDSHPGYCWYVGNMLDMHVTLYDPASPTDGLTVTYGSLNCCPSGQLEPGSFNKVNVKVTLSPALDHCDDPNYWKVNKTDLPDLDTILYKCSPNQTSDLVYNLLSSRLCPEFTDWQLDVNATTLRCEHNASTVTCFVSPVRLIDGQICSQYVCTFPHIYFVFTATNDTQVNRTLTRLADHPNGSCSFRYNADGLRKIEALYNYFQSPSVNLAGHNPYVISRDSKENRLLWLFIVPGVTIVVSVLVVVTVSIAKKAKARLRHSGYSSLPSSFDGSHSIEMKEGEAKSKSLTTSQSSATGLEIGGPSTTSATGKDKMRSVCIVSHPGDRDWSVGAIENRLKEIPNLRLCDAKATTVQSSDYVVIVISKNASDALEDSEDYSSMTEIAEKIVKSGQSSPKPFAVSRDGDMSCIPENLCCVDFSSGHGWQLLKMVFENEGCSTRTMKGKKRRGIPKETSDTTRVTIEPFGDYGYETESKLILGSETNNAKSVAKPDQIVNVDSSSDTQNSARSVSATTQDMPLKCVELCTETELVETTLEHEYHSKTLYRPIPSTPPPDVSTPVWCQPEAECASPSEDKDETQQTPPNIEPGDGIRDDESASQQQGSEACLLATSKDREPNSHSHVLILHHDNSEDAADALRITEDLTRNGISCISHHLTYSEMPEMGEKDWLASSLLHCNCILFICTKAFRDASLRHFFVYQRLFAEAVQSCSASVRSSSPRIFPVIKTVTDRAFIPECMEEFQWFQLPSANQWTELISTICERQPSIDETVGCAHPLSMTSNPANGSSYAMDEVKLHGQDTRSFRKRPRQEMSPSKQSPTERRQTREAKREKNATKKEEITTTTEEKGFQDQEEKNTQGKTEDTSRY